MLRASASLVFVWLSCLGRFDRSLSFLRSLFLSEKKDVPRSSHSRDARPGLRTASMLFCMHMHVKGQGGGPHVLLLPTLSLLCVPPRSLHVAVYVVGFGSARYAHYLQAKGRQDPPATPLGSPFSPPPPPPPWSLLLSSPSFPKLIRAAHPPSRPPPARRRGGRAGPPSGWWCLGSAAPRGTSRGSAVDVNWRRERDGRVSRC